MQGMGNQADAQNQLQDDSQSGNYKSGIETKEMVTVDVKLESVHVQDLQYGRDDKHESQQDL